MSKFRIRAAGLTLLALAAVAPALADSQFRVRRMTRDDVPLGKGQCDIRLQVDGEVEVAVRRDIVSIRTISGQEARDDGSECNEFLPERPPDGFNFEVRDSRNEIRLIAEPSRRSDGAAVVRIRDTSSGFGRYHFRLSWMIGGGGGFQGGPGGPGRPGGRFDDFGPGRPGWRDTVHFSGPGRGEAHMNGPFPFERLGEATVDIDRGGRVQVSIRTEGRRSMVFLGTVVDRDGDRIRADVTTEDRRIRGSMLISVDNRQNVYRMSLDAGGGRERLRLDWERR